MSHLNSLLGKTITDILVSEGTYYPIKTDKSDTSTLKTVSEIILKMEGYSLTISNRFELSPSGENIMSLIDAQIISIRENKSEVVILTSDNKNLTIDLRDEAYFGPEAMCLHGPNNLVVVWQ